MNKPNYKDSDLVLVGFGEAGMPGFRQATEAEQVEHADQLRLNEAAKQESDETRISLLTGKEY